MKKAKWLDKKKQYFKTNCDNLRLREFMRNVFTFNDWKTILKEFLNGWQKINNENAVCRCSVITDRK